jgi:hypothetical protein
MSIATLIAARCSAAIARVTVDLHQPGDRPQALHRHETARQRQPERHKAPEVGAGENRLDAVPLHGQRLRRVVGVTLGNAQEQPDGHRQRQRGEGEEDLPPAGEAQRRLQRGAGGEGTEAPGGHDPAGQRRLPVKRKPQGKCLEGGHQARRNAESNQTATDRQFRDALTEGKDHRAGGSDQQ